MFEEYTYGDVGSRGRKLQKTVNKGDYLFFHTSMKKQRVITAFYYVEELLSVQMAIHDSHITSKFRNPHLMKELADQNDTIVFGNPIYSLILKSPLLMMDFTSMFSSFLF